MPSAEQVVLLQLRDDWDEVFHRITDPDAGGGPNSDGMFEVNVRERVARAEKPRLCLVTSGEFLVALGLITKVRTSGDLDILVRVQPALRLLTGAHLPTLASGMDGRVRRHFQDAMLHTSLLGKATSDAVLAHLANSDSDAAEAIAVLSSRLRELSGPFQASQTVFELTDALRVGLRLAGFKPNSLAGREPSDEGSTSRNYFARLAAAPSRGASEAAVLRHDSTHLPEWLPSDGELLDVVEFTDPDDPDRRVTVIYADREAEERSTGADLIYFRQHSPGFVLVQYKRMRRQPDGSALTYAYRPEASLDEEFARMRAILESIESDPTGRTTDGPASWRLHDQPFWIKLVEETRRRPKRGELVSGMYFPMTLFEAVLDSVEVRGPQKTRPIGWENAGRWFTNTQFLSLMTDGWIGSSGRTTDVLARIIAEVWETGRSTLIVRDDTPS